MAKGHLEKSSCTTNKYWFPLLDMGTLRMSMPTISHGLLVTMGYKGAGGLAGAFTIWQVTQ